MEMDSGQYSLWPEYSFDTIPLEFISSIYETFVTPRDGTVYTPGYLVDFILDGILPWRGGEWNLKILDPACGSGIFLVKAFQRLIYRWKQAHPDQRMSSSDLRSLLENNIFGVDDDPHAVRVASFSLYLAMCDEIDPRHYWRQVHFPVLRGRRLVPRDFFSEDTSGIRTQEDAKQYDIVVGNPPWGKNTTQNSPAAQKWARHHGWPTSYGDIGPLFIAKSAALAKPSGRVSLFQPCGALLFNTTARTVREKLFETFRIEEIVNLSALRFILFKKRGPAALVTLRPQPPLPDKLLTYIIPKPSESEGEDGYRIRIDPYDIHELNLQEALHNPIIWSVFMWGGRRDLALLGWLERWPTLAAYKADKKARTRRGIIRGNREKEQKAILERRILTHRDFKDTFMTLDPEDLDLNNDPWTHGAESTDFSAFEPRQLLVKQTWTVEQGRFKAAIIDPPRTGVLCSDSYISIHTEEQNKAILEAACLSYNSIFAVYYLLLCSGRLVSYRPSVNEPELLAVPSPEPSKDLWKGVKTLTDVDQRVKESFGFKEAEWVLVEDMLRYTLPDFKGGLTSPGRLPTRRHCERSGEKPELHAYCTWFLRVLRAGFGENKSVCATIFEEPTAEHLPVRLVAIHLGWTRPTDITVERIKNRELVERLRRVYQLLVGETEQEISFRRVARVFDTLTQEGKHIPTIFIVKPDQARYWSRSIALRDADEVSLEIMRWKKNRRG